MEKLITIITSGEITYDKLIEFICYLSGGMFFMILAIAIFASYKSYKWRKQWML